MKFVCVRTGLLRHLIMGPLYPLVAKWKFVTFAFPLTTTHKHAVKAFSTALRRLEFPHSIGEDVARILDLYIDRDLQRQLARNMKTGTAPQFGFVGSDHFYRELASTRYRDVPRPPDWSIDLLTFTIIDELVHEALHVLFLAQARRVGCVVTHSYFAEEVTVSYWSAVLLAGVYRDWLTLDSILRINYDFFLVAANARTFCFWDEGYVLEGQAQVSSWLTEIVRELPQRDIYIGERPDIISFYAELREHRDAAFVFEQHTRLLRLPLRLPANRDPTQEVAQMSA